MPHVTDVFKGTSLRMKLRSPTIMFLLRTVLTSPFRHTIQHHPSDIPISPEGSPEFWLKLMISMGLVLAGGVFAGCMFWIRTYLTIFIYSDFFDVDLHLAWWVWMSCIYESWLHRRIIPRRRSMLGKVDCILYSSSFLSKCLTSSQHYAKRPSLGPGGMFTAY